MLHEKKVRLIRDRPNEMDACFPEYETWSSGYGFPHVQIVRKPDSMSGPDFFRAAGRI